MALDRAMRLRRKESDRNLQTTKKTNVIGSGTATIDSTTNDNNVVRNIIEYYNCRIFQSSIQVDNEPMTILRVIDESPTKNTTNNNSSIRDIVEYGERKFDLHLVLPNSPPKKRKRIDLSVMDAVLDSLHRK